MNGNTHSPDPSPLMADDFLEEGGIYHVIGDIEASLGFTLFGGLGKVIKVKSFTEPDPDGMITIQAEDEYGNLELYLQEGYLNSCLEKL